MIEEAKDYGNPMSGDEIEYEMKRANHWAMIIVNIIGQCLIRKRRKCVMIKANFSMRKRI